VKKGENSALTWKFHCPPSIPMADASERISPEVGGKINFGQALIWSKSPCETDPLAGFSAVAGLKYPNAMAFIIFLVSIFLVQLS